MIYTVTFNPAIDYVVHIDNLETGKIQRSKSQNIYFGGKGINVSIILKELSVPSTALGFIAGFSGKAIEDGISCNEIKTDFVTLNSGLTRINVKIRSEEETDINGNGPEITDSDIDKLFSKLECLKDEDFLILAGSIPNTLPFDIYEQILAKLENKKIKFVVDAEKDLLLNSLKYKPFLIKPNCEELSEIFGTEISTAGMCLEYAKKLKDMGALNVLVSMGDKGAVLLDQNGEEYFMKAPVGKTVNTVGAGDSMVAGFIAGYIETNDYSYALKLGTASGAATAFSDGLATKKMIFEILKEK